MAARTEPCFFLCLWYELAHFLAKKGKAVFSGVGLKRTGPPRFSRALASRDLSSLWPKALSLQQAHFWRPGGLRSQQSERGRVEWPWGGRAQLFFRWMQQVDAAGRRSVE